MNRLQSWKVWPCAAVVALLVVASCMEAPEGVLGGSRSQFASGGAKLGARATAPTVNVAVAAPRDGGETGLGAPSIPIASGSGIVAAGTGLMTQPGTINLFVPGTVQQALLYWSGEGEMVGDDMIDVEINLVANAIMGTLIGGPENFYLDVFASTYRADITPLISSGANALTVSGMDFSVSNNGAGLLVIYDDGSTTGIQLVDGQDLAFANFAPPLDATVPQTFNFASAGVDRTATLTMFFASVEPGRPNRIQVTIDGTVTNYDNLLASNDGPDWDTIAISFNVPAGETSVTVEAISLDDGSGALPASLNWMAAGLTLAPAALCGDGVVDPGEECDDGPDNSDTEPGACRTDCTLPFCGDGVTDPDEECDDGVDNSDTEPGACRTDCTLPFCGDGVVDPGEQCDPPDGVTCDDQCQTIEVGGEGCTPGYWKQPHHFDSWVTYSPDDLFDVVFGVDGPGDQTLLQALTPGAEQNALGGTGPQNALGRHAVAALLNAASAGVDYSYTEAEVIAIVQDAYDTGDFETAKGLLETQNQSGCPLN